MGLAPSLAEKCADGEDDKVMMAYQVIKDFDQIKKYFRLIIVVDFEEKI